MYSDLFSSMDGARSLFMWTLPLMFLFSIWSNKMFMSNVLSAIWQKVTNIWNDNSLLRFNFFRTMISSLFLFLIMNNLMGLSPMSYTFTSNLFMVSSMACSLWLTLLLSGYMKNPSESLAHLAPSGAPLVLLPFLVLIETISILIRPLTLTVRMIANISAGHIVLGLLANAATYFLHSTFCLIMIIMVILYTLFEFFVSIIQAYIFTLLLTLYSTEHP